MVVYGFFSFSEATRAGYIILIFVLVLLFVNLVTLGLFLLWRHHKTIKYWAQPPLEIPSHFKEVMCKHFIPAPPPQKTVMILEQI